MRHESIDRPPQETPLHFGITARRALFALAFVATLPPSAQAQETNYPTKPLTIVVPFSAGGGVDMTFVSLAGARPFIKDGRVRAIAMTSATRSSLAPELHAIAETKRLEKYALENWFGLFAPAATSPAIVQKLNTAVTQALKEPDLVARLRDLGGEPAPMASAQFKGFIQSESARFAKLVEEAKITPEN
jgi:tripartite-type tricarboxylate transporter receptor subunit TctC